MAVCKLLAPLFTVHRLPVSDLRTPGVKDAVTLRFGLVDRRGLEAGEAFRAQSTVLAMSNATSWIIFREIVA